MMKKYAMVLHVLMLTTIVSIELFVFPCSAKAVTVDINARTNNYTSVLSGFD